MTTNKPLGVLTIPAFKDNYFWLIHNDEAAVIVDPGNAKDVLLALNHYRLRLVAILVTHHHPDHTGGVQQLLDICKVPVFGPNSDKIPGVSHPVAHQDFVSIPEMGLELMALAVPGHTLDHFAYIATSHGWLFCGDTLFGAGCGRVFEGTPAQMYASLSLLASMADTTLVFCAHEYTLSNLRFAATVEPGNKLLQARLKVDQDKRTHNRPTIPSNIGLEKRTNPFLRCTEPEVIASLIQHGKLDDGKDPVAVFAALREWKNNFK